MHLRGCSDDLIVILLLITRSTVPGLSPVPRPSPSPTANSLTGHPPGSAPGSLGGHLSLQPPTSSPFGGYNCVPPQHALPSPHPAASANMFAPPILPLSSITSHPSSQPPSFGAVGDPLFAGESFFYKCIVFNYRIVRFLNLSIVMEFSGPSSDMVRRDLESRLISGDRIASGGPSPFLARPSDLHPHHPLLPPLSGVGHLPPHTGAPPAAPPSHAALFHPPLVNLQFVNT